MSVKSNRLFLGLFIALIVGQGVAYLAGPIRGGVLSACFRALSA